MASRHFANARRVTGEIENIGLDFGMVAEQEDWYRPLVGSDELVGLRHQARHDLAEQTFLRRGRQAIGILRMLSRCIRVRVQVDPSCAVEDLARVEVCGLEIRSEEHTSELQSLMRISYSVFCL